MERFYCVTITISRLGDGEKPVPYFYKSLEQAEAHINQYRQETLKGRNDYRIVRDSATNLLLRSHNWTDCELKLTECYFED